MHPSINARTQPDKPAYVMAGSGETVTYGQLDARSNQGAQLFRALGLAVGDVIAILMDNNPRFFEIAWAAQRAGLYYTCVSTKLTPAEVEYIVEDCGARALIVSPALDAIAEAVAPLVPGVRLFRVGGARGPFEDFEAARDALPATPIADETAGSDMLYSSGTTGRPKGVKPPLGGGPIDAPHALQMMAQGLFGFSGDSLYLSPAPLYHAAPLRWCMSVHKLGGTVIVMEKFEPEAALALIEKHGITCGQFVPTHFVRMLKLPQAVRDKYDVSSMRSAVHAEIGRAHV